MQMMCIYMTYTVANIWFERALSSILCFFKKKQNVRVYAKLRIACPGTVGLHGDAPFRTPHGPCTGGCVIRVPYHLTFSEKRAQHLGFEVSVGAATFTAPPPSSPSGIAPEHAPEGEDDAYLGQLRKAEYVADWLAGSELSSQGGPNESRDNPNSGSSGEGFASQQERNTEGSAFLGLSRSEPSTGDLASSHSQWSAASGASDALSTKWWSLAASAVEGAEERGRQVEVKGCERSRRQPLAVNR